MTHSPVSRLFFVSNKKWKLLFFSIVKTRFITFWDMFKSFCHGIITAANEVWGKVIFLYLFVILFTGGACVVTLGGCAWLLPEGGHAWLLWGMGGMHGCSWGGAWLLPGGGGHVCMVALGVMHGCSRGSCMVAPGGVCVVAPRGACMGYDEIWRYDQ